MSVFRRLCRRMAARAGACAAVLCLSSALLSSCAVDKAALVKRIDLHDVDLGNVADGVYEGSFTVSYPAAAANKSARVRVTVAGGRYERIELLQPPLSGTWADTLLDRVREKQSLSSDAISSGTITAAAILRAIQTAVESAPAAPGR